MAGDDGAFTRKRRRKRVYETSEAYSACSCFTVVPLATALATSAQSIALSQSTAPPEQAVSDSLALSLPYLRTVCRETLSAAATLRMERPWLNSDLI